MVLVTSLSRRIEKAQRAESVMLGKRGDVMKLRLRTKFLLSMLLISAGLTSVSLLLVRHRVDAQIRKEIFADLENSVSTFQNFQRERETTLSHSADLLADLPNLRAMMTTHHPATIQDASSDLWRLAGSDLFVLADRTGAVVALHTSSNGFTPKDGGRVTRVFPESYEPEPLVVWRSASLPGISKAYLFRLGS